MTSIIDLVTDRVHDPIVKRYLNHKTKIVIRTDNGPQFIAKKLAAALDSFVVAHEFIDPGAPQQNGHIESFHITVSRLVCKRKIFESLDHAADIFVEFYRAYNGTRVMKSLPFYPPKPFLKLWESGIIAIKKDKNGKELFYFREKPLPNFVFGFSPEDLYRINKINMLENHVLTP